ncbi:unnamed protein product [Penicillium nalgiovense]|uniref:Uncharacterized protein n=1 Tax=Penicillium nalgiovense TaxID=60175 RepID=A0A9W4HMQ9_PENNA|nr:unnamed protein product [Penicillium nalgiovense]CAG7960706.1 unnamed protein product [Penicillium nalgiovense]CAG7961435.1 unnamed protein product [Penicillium nalgiovense]CAG8021238.1 unnamed protein product [Penicillium nalgiovense]CAG8021764.1 unnamed protein product [Penicillium nalgiovense]
MLIYAQHMDISPFSSLLSCLVTSRFSIQSCGATKLPFSCLYIGHKLWWSNRGTTNSDCWLAMFYLIVVCLVVALWRFPGASTSVPRQYSGIMSYLKPLRGLDFVSLSFLEISIGTLMVLLQTVQQYGLTAHPRTITFGVTFVTSATIFVVNEHYLSRHPIISTSALKEDGSWAICLGQTILPLFCFLSLRTFQCFMFDYAEPKSAYPAWTMRYKKLSIIGLGTIVASSLALIWRSSASYLSLIPGFLAGTGMKGLFTIQFIALSARSRGGHAGTTITAYYLAQQLESIIGVTTSATIVRTLFANDLRWTLHGVSQIDELIQRILNNNRFAEALPETIQSHVRQSFRCSFRAIPVLCLCMILAEVPIIVIPRQYSIS